MTDVFLSYSREDQPTARRYAEGFEQEGFSVWWDAALNPGETFDHVTEQALKEARAVVVLWSKRSVTSRWVRSEASQADRYGTLVPVMIEPCDRPIMFELSHTADLSNWNGKPDDAPWRALIDGLRRFVNKGAPATGNSTSYSVPKAPPKSGWVRRPGLVLAVVAIAMAAGAFLLWNLRGHVGDLRVATPSVQALPAPANPSVQAASNQASIAVMPFENRTGDAGKEYFSDGMAEELIDRLSKVEGLKVASRTSSFAYKGKGADIRQVARDLGVKTVLVGSVRSAGETIRINVQLADAESGYNLWSESYERQYGDIFKIQDDLASQIVTAFRMTMGAKLPEYVSQKPPTENLEAYSLFLQARSIAAGTTRADLDRAQQLLAEALRIDPGFAIAKVAASTIQMLGVVTGVYGPEVLTSSEKLADEALRLDPDLGGAYTILGSIASLRGKWVEAAELFSRAHELEPAAEKSAFATFLAGAAGKTREVEVAANESFRQAPGEPVTVTVMGATSFMLGRNAEARKYVEMAINLGRPANIAPLPRILSDLKLRAGDFDGAAQIAVDALSPEWRERDAEQAVRAVYAGLADPRRLPQARQALKRFVANAGPSVLLQGDREMTIMAWFTLLGDLDAAYARAHELVDTGRRIGYVGRLWVWVWPPELLPFRRDPRFQPLMKEIGLMDYWKKYGPPDSCELTNDKLTCH